MTEVVVLIPHYNDVNGLEKSLSSISEDETIDVIIVDDGSMRKPNIDDLKLKFPKLNFDIIYLDSNQGIENALNQGLRSVVEKGYKYIARLDCRDICYPNRFGIQKRFLENYPDIHLVGTWVSFVDLEGKELFILRPPFTQSRIKLQMYINNIFCHPTVMFRVKAIVEIGYYPTIYKSAEDYGYFFEFVRHYQTAIIPQILVKCELNPTGISLSKRQQQLQSRLQVIRDNFYWGFYPVYGLIRNTIIALLPFSVIYKLKRRH